MNEYSCAFFFISHSNFPQLLDKTFLVENEMSTFSKIRENIVKSITEEKRRHMIPFLDWINFCTKKLESQIPKMLPTNSQNTHLNFI